MLFALTPSSSAAAAPALVTPDIAAAPITAPSTAPMSTRLRILRITRTPSATDRVARVAFSFQTVVVYYVHHKFLRAQCQRGPVLAATGRLFVPACRAILR